MLRCVSCCKLSKVLASVILRGTLCRVRPWTEADAEPLARLADEVAIARWMTATFPNPYTLEVAQAWVTKSLAEDPIDNFVVEVDGCFAGGAGLKPRAGEQAGVAEFGYWLGRAYWGRGIATEAAQLLADHALKERQLRRLEAHVFLPNVASARVLEKSGFVREALLREAYVERDGTIVDGLLYARLRSDNR